MQDAFNNPPASVFLTCAEGLKRFGIRLEELQPHQRATWLEFTAFVATSTAGRICASLPAPELCRRASDATALQVRHEVLEVLKEASFCAGADSKTSN